MFSCKDITTEAQALIDGELSLSKRIGIRFHLLICKYCRRYVNQLMLTIRTLRETDILEPENLEPSDAEIDDIVAKLKNSQI